jgi:hypothetical protein
MSGGAGTRFEDRLLAELMPLVGAMRPAEPVVPGARFRARQGAVLPVPRRRIAALLGVVLLVVVGLGLATALWPHQLATSAYAVQQQSDGSVLVTVNDLTDPRGLESALASNHVPATVLVVIPGQACAELAQTMDASGAIQGRPDHPNVVSIRPDLIPAGSRAVLGLVGSGSGRLVTLFTVVAGPAPVCFPGAVPIEVPTS